MMMFGEAATSHSGLRVISGAAPERPLASGFKTHSSRPGEHHVGLPVTLTPQLHDRYRAAQRCRLPGGLCLALILERWLVEEGLREACRPEAGEVIAYLDAVACDTAGSLRSAAPAADYLRALLGLAAVPPSQRRVGAALVVPIPTRLSACAGEEDLLRAAAGVTVQQAVRWELAALVEGRVMAEWAFSCLLDPASAATA
jgi:hypothetical protein